jgi:hypothetical protein
VGASVPVASVPVGGGRGNLVANTTSVNEAIARKTACGVTLAVAARNALVGGAGKSGAAGWREHL